MCKIVAIIAGVLVGSWVFFIFGAIGSTLQAPLPESINMSDPGYNELRVAATPVTAWLLTLTGIILGSFLAGAIGTVVSGEKTALVTFGIGGILSLWVLFGVLTVPEMPLWFDLASLVSYLLFTYQGSVVMGRVLERKTN